MNGRELKSFPGDLTGKIQILIKSSNQEEAVQLRFELDIDVSTTNS